MITWCSAQGLRLPTGGHANMKVLASGGGPSNGGCITWGRMEGIGFWHSHELHDCESINADRET